MRASLYRAGKDLRPYSVTLAAVEEKKLRVIAINETKAVQEARKQWRADQPKVTCITRLPEAA